MIHAKIKHDWCVQQIKQYISNSVKHVQAPYQFLC